MLALQKWVGLVIVYPISVHMYMYIFGKCSIISFISQLPCIGASLKLSSCCFQNRYVEATVTTICSVFLQLDCGMHNML